MLYRLLGYFIRRDACRLAAQAFYGNAPADGTYTPRLWSLTVFFEQYVELKEVAQS